MLTMEQGRVWLLCALAMAVPAGVLAQEADEAVVLDSVTVSGVQPGPGLWRVSRGDHHLWLVGTLAPVPKNMDWRPGELDERLAEADAILEAPSVALGTGRGRLHALTLAPSAVGLRNNPGRQTLQDVVSPESYARWIELKGRYLGNNRRIERWRPIFAAQKLHEAAIEANAMERRSPVGARIDEAARARGLPEVSATVSVTIDDPRHAIREFKTGDIADVECFEATLQRLESDIGLMRGRANAWATGDLDTLRVLSGVDPAAACIQAMLGAGALAKRGLDDLESRVHAAWLESAEQALAEYPVTVGALQIGELMREGGLLDQLAARGYQVLAPDDAGDDALDGDDGWDEVPAAAPDNDVPVEPAGD